MIEKYFELVVLIFELSSEMSEEVVVIMCTRPPSRRHYLNISFNPHPLKTTVLGNGSSSRSHTSLFFANYQSVKAAAALSVL